MPVEHITGIYPCRYLVFSRAADIFLVAHPYSNQLKLFRSTFILALCLSSSASVYANLHRYVDGPMELASLRPFAAMQPMVRRSHTPRTTLAKSNTYFLLGVDAINTERYVDAIEDFSQVLSLRRSTSSLVNRGTAYLHIGNRGAAIANFTAALESNPRATFAWIGRGNAYALEGRYAEALADYNSALSLQPSQAEAHIGRGYVWALQKQYEKAGDDYLFVARQRATSPQLYQSAGIWYGSAKQYDRAIAAFTEAIRLDPQAVKTYVLRARTYRHQDNTAAAIADLSSAVRLDPTNTDLRVERASAFEHIGDLSAAADDYEAIQRLDPRSVEAYVYRADDLTDMGRDDEARRDYAIASRLAPDDMRLLYGRMQFSFYQTDYAAAISDADAWLRLKPASQNRAREAHNVYYVLIWRHMAAQRLGIDDARMLKAAESQLDPARWPYPIIAFYLGRIGEAQLRAAASVGDAATARGHQCEMGVYLGDLAAAHGLDDVARKDFVDALPMCPAEFLERILAGRDLSKLDELRAVAGGGRDDSIAARPIAP